MAHSDAREGKRRGNWRMQWVASTLHTTSEHGVSNITTADGHTSAAGSQYFSHYLGTWCIQHYYRWWCTSRLSHIRMNWRPCIFKWTRPFRRKTKSGFCAINACSWFYYKNLSHCTVNWTSYLIKHKYMYKCTCNGTTRWQESSFDFCRQQETSVIWLCIRKVIAHCCIEVCRSAGLLFCRSANSGESKQRHVLGEFKCYYFHPSTFAQQPLPGLGLPHNTPQFIPIFNSSLPSCNPQEL